MTGAASLSANNGVVGTGNIKYSITLANALNNFGGAVSTVGSNINLYDSAGGLILGNTTASGNFAATSKGGDLTQLASTTVSVTSSTRLTADNALTGINNAKYNITLANAGNDFVGTVSSMGSNINLMDSIGTFYLGSTTASGTFTATAKSGFLMQPSLTVVNVSGATALTADNGLSGTSDVKYNISLAQAGNHFGGAVSANGSAIALLNSSGSLVLGSMVAGNSLSVSSLGGDITQSAAFNVTGVTSLVADSGVTKYNITLDNVANRLLGYVASNGANIKLVNGGGNLVLGNTTASGYLMASSLSGNISQLSGTSVSVVGATTLVADNGVSGLGDIRYNITLANAANILTGVVSATGNSISLTDAVALSAILNSSGAVTLISAGAMTVSGIIGSNLTTTTTGGTLSTTTFGVTSVASKLKVTSSGAVRKVASNTSVTVNGSATSSNNNVTVNNVVGASIL